MPRTLESSTGPGGSDPAIKWKPCRIDGQLLCYVDQDDETHIGMWHRKHGEKVWKEFKTTEIINKTAA